MPESPELIAAAVALLANAAAYLRAATKGARAERETSRLLHQVAARVARQSRAIRALLKRIDRIESESVQKSA